MPKNRKCIPIRLTLNKILNGILDRSKMISDDITEMQKGMDSHRKGKHGNKPKSKGKYVSKCM